MSVKRPTIIRLNTVYQMAGFVGCAPHHRLHSTWDSGPIIVKTGVHPMSACSSQTMHVIRLARRVTALAN